MTLTARVFSGLLSQEEVVEVSHKINTRELCKASTEAGTFANIQGVDESPKW